METKGCHSGSFFIPALSKNHKLHIEHSKNHKPKLEAWRNWCFTSFRFRRFVLSWYDMQTKNFQQLKPACQHVRHCALQKLQSDNEKSETSSHHLTSQHLPIPYQSHMTKNRDGKDRVRSRKQKIQQTIQTGNRRLKVRRWQTGGVVRFPTKSKPKTDKYPCSAAQLMTSATRKKVIALYHPWCRSQDWKRSIATSVRREQTSHGVLCWLAFAGKWLRWSAIRKMLEDKASRISTIEWPGESQSSDGKKQSWISHVGNIWVVVWSLKSVIWLVWLVLLRGGCYHLLREAGASSEISKSSRTSGLIWAKDWVHLSWTRDTLLPDRKYCSYPFVIMKSAWWDSRLTLLPIVCRELLPLAFLLHLLTISVFPAWLLFKIAKALFSQILLSILLCCGGWGPVAVVEDLSSLFRRSSLVSSLRFPSCW